MEIKKKVTISWSGGKDCALALYRILCSQEYDVMSLHTVIDKDSGRVGLHGVREDLIELQAESIGLPLVKLYLEGSQNHDPYEKIMTSFYQRCFDEGVDGVMFGDIFLEDLREYRERLLLTTKLSSIYPLWKEVTSAIFKECIDVGFKTMICSANANFFRAEALGKPLDLSFPETLPPRVDICGENGEFHTFVYDGPIFRKKILVSCGSIVSRTYSYQNKNAVGEVENSETTFLFQDLMPLMD